MKLLALVLALTACGQAEFKSVRTSGTEEAVPPPPPAPETPDLSELSKHLRPLPTNWQPAAPTTPPTDVPAQNCQVPCAPPTPEPEMDDGITY
jgi:hypothetical protein